MQTVLLCVSGASGAPYAKFFIEQTLLLEDISLGIIFTQTAQKVWEHEIGISFNAYKNSICAEYKNVEFIDNNNFEHKFASGSNFLGSMIVLPCSMGSLARIAGGVSIDLIGRIADVQLKERRKLIIVPREAPYSLIHINNMLSLTQSGAIICPASPSFYTLPQSLNDLIASFTERIMDIAGIKKLSGDKKWSSR